MGEHPRQGNVIEKFGSGISWWPSGSPGLVLGAGIGWRPSCVEVIPVGIIVGTTLVALTDTVPLTNGGNVKKEEEPVASAVDCVVKEIGAEGISPVCAGGIAIDDDTAPSGRVGAANDGSSGTRVSAGIVLDDRGADGISPVGNRARGSDGTILEVRGADGMRPVGNFVEVLSAGATSAVPSMRNT